MFDDFHKGFGGDFDRQWGRIERHVRRRSRLILALRIIWALWSIGLVTAMVFMLGRWSGVW